jgi:zinc transport system substrate-binding protein
MRSFLALWLLAASVGCQSSAPPDTKASEEASNIPEVIVTSQPLLEIAQSLAGDEFLMTKIVPDGVSSRHWKPSKEDVQQMQKADAILISGASYEPWKNRITLPGSRVKDAAADYYQQLLVIPDAVTHQHGPEGKHAHAGTLWATWLDPELAGYQVSRVAQALIALQPQRKAAIETEAARLKLKLETLNSLISEIRTATTDSGMVVVGDSPSYQYLTDRLGWKLQYLHWDDSTAFSDENRDELIELLKSQPELVQRSFLLGSKYPDVVAEFASTQGMKVIRIDLCEHKVDSADSWIDRLANNLTLLKASVVQD